MTAQLVTEDGTPCLSERRRFSEGNDVALGLVSLLEEWSSHQAWQTLKGLGLGLEKSQRLHLPSALLRERLPKSANLVMLPATQAILLGAIPYAPGLLISLGSALRLATCDSTHVYREFRLQEGGGAWWVQELLRISEHSPRLRQRLSALGANESQLLRAVPSLLELADYPGPDPVLKIRLDGLCTTIANSCLGLSSRLPGLGRVALSGFLHPSPMSQRITRNLTEQDTHLRIPKPRFPASVGAALVALAAHKEMQERQLLGKSSQSSGEAAKLGDWGAPVDLIRRLYRIRKPFDRYPSPDDL